MARRQDVERLDPALIARIADMSAGGQRWLKTAIQTVKSIPLDEEEREEALEVQKPAPAPRAPRRRAPEPEPESEARMPDLEDVLTGKASLKDLEAYPELGEELEGLGDIIDMLRSLGEERRKRGEQILREDILGERATEDDEDFSF